MPKHVAVLMGGMSSEREVSLTSGKAVLKAVEALGHKATAVDVAPDVAEVLAGIKPDVAFNALHGTFGEDGCIQGVLEILGIPYTHSGVAASAIAMDKQLTKHMLIQEGIRCAEGRIATRQEVLAGKVMAPPYVIKPNADGSSVGVVIVRKAEDAPKENELTVHTSFLVEKYIPGKELSVAVTDDGPLGVLELRPKQGFYDYKNKYTDGMTEHLMPAPIDADVYNEAMQMAYKAHLLLQCRGVSRADIRYDEEGDGKLYMLEVNTHPGLTPLSILPEIAAYRGMNFEKLVAYLLDKATCEKPRPNAR